VIAGPEAAEARGVAAQEISGHARLVEKDVLPRIVQRHGLMPGATGGGDVIPTLFVGVDCFF